MIFDGRICSDLRDASLYTGTLSVCHALTCDSTEIASLPLSFFIIYIFSRCVAFCGRRPKASPLDTTNFCVQKFDKKLLFAYGAKILVTTQKTGKSKRICPFCLIKVVLRSRCSGRCWILYLPDGMPVAVPVRWW